MKNIYLKVSVLLLSFIIWSCQNEETVSDKGYLRVNVDTFVSVITQETRVAADYNPKQIAVRILDSSNKVVRSVTDWTELSGVQLELEAGTYTINASSNGFDGSESGFDIPYYAGSAQVTIPKGKEVTANIICTLANVKVTVNFDATFVQAFQSAAALRAGMTVCVCTKMENIHLLHCSLLCNDDFKTVCTYKEGVGPLCVSGRRTEKLGTLN